MKLTTPGVLQMGNDVRDIRIFDLSFDLNFRKEFHRGVEQIFDEGHLSNHTFCRKFEQKFADFLGVNSSLLVSSGTSALEVALRVLDLNNKKVLIPVNTFIATSIACENVQAIPIFGDIDSNYFTLNLATIKNSVKQDPGIKAVVLVHIGGHIIPEIEEIVYFCKKNDIRLIEDCAHAHASSHNGRRAGTFGDFGCFSHYMTKVMTMGEGGSLISSDPELLKKAESIRSFGHDLTNKINHIQRGSNFKATEFQGLLGLLDLKRVNGRVAKRRMLAHRYQENLSGSRWNAIGDPVGGESDYYKQIVISPVPLEQVENAFKEKGISLTGSIYQMPLHRQPIYREQYRDKLFPNADKFADSHFCPPCYPELELEDIDRVSEVLIEL